MATKKLVSYNVNGIRAALKKGFDDWLNSNKYDIVCLQETKAQEEQVDKSFLKAAGYSDYWHSAEKKGYSGVAIFSLVEPDSITIGCGIEKYDREGRIIRADYGDTSVLNCYFPSGTSGDERQAFKMEFLDDFFEWAGELKKEHKNLIICGDYNIAHTEIDIHNPVTNKNTSGFKPEEREWMTKFFDSGFIDSFRAFNTDPHEYSWWSYRAGARKNNKGWRIDYISATNAMENRLKNASILQDIVHSDHCPTLLELEF